MDILKTLGGLFMGAGAMEDDPQKVFQMYAPPGMESLLTPEQQSAYGEQIRQQMRRINADYRPTYSQIQNGLIQGMSQQMELQKYLE